MYNYINQNLPIGAVVLLDRFPGTKWIICNGWYVYENVKQNGTYLKSIPAGTVLPMTADDAVHMTIVSGSMCNPHITHPPCYDQTNTLRPIEQYLSGVNYTRGQIIWLTAGDIYQVSENFTSTSDSDSDYANLMKDVEIGNLVPIGSYNSESGDPVNISRIPENTIDSLFLKGE